MGITTLINRTTIHHVMGNISLIDKEDSNEQPAKVIQPTSVPSPANQGEFSFAGCKLSIILSIIIIIIIIIIILGCKCTTKCESLCLSQNALQGSKVCSLVSHVIIIEHTFHNSESPDLPPLPRVIRGKLLLSIHRQLYAVQYGENDRSSLLALVQVGQTINSPNTTHTFCSGQLGRIRV